MFEVEVKLIDGVGAEPAVVVGLEVREAMEGSSPDRVRVRGMGLCGIWRRLTRVGAGLLCGAPLDSLLASGSFLLMPTV